MTCSPSPGAPASAARRRIAVPGPQDLVSISDSPHAIVSLIHPATSSVDLAAWVASNRPRLESLLSHRGAVLFRGFRLAGPAEFHQVVEAWSPNLLTYTYGSTPRSRSSVAGVYTSTEYPADQSIPQHNEMSYARAWPRNLWFFCHKAASAGGATPLSSSSKVAARLTRSTLRCLADRGVLYVRRYGTGFDLNWQQAFETDSRSDVASFCREQGIEFAWSGDGADVLQTSQVCQAVVEHPVTGAELWFNQAHLFHSSALAGEVEDHGQLEFTRQAFLGDGEPIPTEMLDEVRAAYVAESVREPWQDGDVLLIDNMLVAHGRDPYSGPRRVLVAMTDEYRGIGGTT